MWTAERLDLSSVEHGGLLYDLALACKEQFLNDYDTNIAVVVEDYHQRIQSGLTHAFLARINGEFAGVIWVETDRYEWGQVHAGMMPDKRATIATMRILQWFLGYCFGELGLRALEATVAKENLTAERVIKAVGFKKMGLRPAAVLIDGQPVTHVMRRLLKEEYEDNKRYDKVWRKQRKQPKATASAYTAT